MEDKKYLDSFINSYIENVGIRTLSEKEFNKLMDKSNYTKNINISSSELQKRYRIFITNKDVFLTEKENFNLGDNVCVCSSGKRKQNHFRKNRNGQVVYIGDKFITIHYDYYNYNESILYSSLQQCEYLIYKDGM